MNAGTPTDHRLLETGLVIPTEAYADQPYIVQTDDGAWLCTVTTGRGREGASSQHVVSLRSADRGRTWSAPVSLEPDDVPENSYAVLLKSAAGRIYCFYNFNADNRRDVLCEDGSLFRRVDSLGEYVFRYSDDHGRTWSPRRYTVPVREFRCDRENVYGGKVRFFWNVGRPLMLEGGALLVLHKVGAMGAGFFAQSEGCFLFSDNILTEPDPGKVRFETRPDGEIGLRTPPGGGRVAEEQSLSRLSDGSVFCVYRTVDGWPVCAYSRDRGRTWTPPAYLTYTPGGSRRVKNPRAANFAWNAGQGRFLYWFHNHGGRFVREMSGHASRVDGLSLNPDFTPYDDRNPVWLTAGREVETENGLCIEWGEPEIVLYDDDPYIRISYPDLVQEGGRFWLTETQKATARLHELDAKFLDDLFNQWDLREAVTEDQLLDLTGRDWAMPAEVSMPRLPDFTRRDGASYAYGREDLRRGFAVELAFRLGTLDAGQILFDSRTGSGKGIALLTTDRGTVELVLNDGRGECRWDCDPGMLQAGRSHHMVVNVDGGPRIITFVVDGILCDGGDARQFGWGRFSPNLYNVTGGDSLRIAPGMNGRLEWLRVYGRYLRTSECVGNYRAWTKQR